MNILLNDTIELKFLNPYNTDFKTASINFNVSARFGISIDKYYTLRPKLYNYTFEATKIKTLFHTESSLDSISKILKHIDSKFHDEILNNLNEIEVELPVSKRVKDNFLLTDF